jgi:L-asparaginase
VAERKPYILVGLKRAPELPRPIATNPSNFAALYKVVIGDDGRALEKFPSLGYKGLILEALGGGHVPARMVPIVAELARRMPVVLSSRTRNGRILRETYGFSGSEMDLFAHGVIDGGWLDGQNFACCLSSCCGLTWEEEACKSIYIPSTQITSKQVNSRFSCYSAYHACMAVTTLTGANNKQNL